MGTTSDRVMRKLVTILVLCPLILWAQKPFINKISPTHAEVGEKITISGSKLTGVNQVLFGGVKSSSVNVVSDNLIEATVPEGATHGYVVVQKSGNSMTQSSEQFFISFSGASINKYDSEFKVSSGLTDAYDVCMCDFSGDGKNDIAMSHNANSGSEVTIYENNTSGTGALTAANFVVSQTINESNNATGSLSITCGDLNKDGTSELVFTSNGVTNTGDVFVYRRSGASMTAATSLKLPSSPSGNRGVRRVKIADIDGDGNPDLVVGSSSPDGSSSFFVYTGNGDLTFDSPKKNDVNNIKNTTSLDLADFNNDGSIDVVTLPFREANERIAILKNTSRKDQVSFVQQAGISTLAQRINVVTADFNGDGFIDIAITNQQLQRVTIYQNTSSEGGDITFGSPINVSTPGAGPWGIDIGDMDGDGKPDIVVASTTAINDLYAIKNTSSSASISFSTPTTIGTTSTGLNVVVGDVNNDARADIVFSHNIQLGNPGNLGIFLNRNCVKPVISPSNTGFTMCSGESYTFEGTKTFGATYLWEIDPPAAGTIASPSTNSTSITLNATANIKLTITHDNGESYQCSESTSVSYTVIGSGSKPTPPTFTPTSQNICVGDNHTITTSGGPFAAYEWTKPDGTTVSTGSTGSLDITNAALEDAGLYTVRVKSAATGCFSDESATFSLSVSKPPLFVINNEHLDDFCTGKSITLAIPDFTGGGLNYQWQKGGTNIAGQTNATLSVTESGSYTVEVTDANTCKTETVAYAVNAITVPNSVAEGPTEICFDVPASFTSASTGQGSFTLQYEWIIKDGTNATIHTASTENMDYTFTAAGSYQVTLNTSYDPAQVYAGPNASDKCVSSDVISVTVSTAPSITFDPPKASEPIKKCQADSVTINLKSPVAGDIQSYKWSIRNYSNGTPTVTPDTTSKSSIEVSTPAGVDSVWLIANITTKIGCEVTDSIKIENFPSSLDIEFEGSGSGTPADTVVLDEATSISLSALKSKSDVSWSPGANFSDSTSTNPIFFPQQPLTVVTLTAKDDQGCLVSTEIRVVLDNLRPKRTFSPNGDGRNDCWEILNSSQPNTEGCKVYVFDARGRNIFVGDAPFANNCVWDGTFNGSSVPEGIYYFVFKCDNDGQMNKSGSILLAR